MSLSSVLGTIAGKVSGFITKDVEPAIMHFLGLVGHDIVTKGLPIATSALGAVESSVITAAASGDWDGVGAAIGTATSSTIKQVVGVIEGATVNDAVFTLNTALGSHAPIQAALAAANGPAPQPAPPQPAS